MTTLREAAQQALEALESAEVDPHSSDAVYKAITALRAALAEPVQEELKPKLGKRAIKAFEAALAQVEKETAHAAEGWQDTTQMGYVVKPYTAPPQRKPLAEWQINDLMADIDPEDVCSWSFRQGVYAAEKHHGVRP